MNRILFVVVMLASQADVPALPTWEPSSTVSIVADGNSWREVVIDYPRGLWRTAFIVMIGQSRDRWADLWEAEVKHDADELASWIAEGKCVEICVLLDGERQECEPVKYNGRSVCEVTW